MLPLLDLHTASACSLVSLLLLFLSSIPSSTCLPEGSIAPRATAPAPISFAPAQNWEGIDGTWNTFVLRIGTPAQAVRVMISTASQQVWAIDPRGCPDDTATNSTCSEARGMTFNYPSSTSWKKIGLYDLWVESNLGLTGNAEYGYDTVGLGYPGEGGPTLTGQTVGALATTDFYFGHFGIAPKPTNFTNFTSQSPSFLSSLKDQGYIPSVSWGYTAGVPYRFAKVLASLTLGGYDEAKFIPNGISFPFAPDNERDILVSVTSVRSADATGKQTTLLSNSIYSYVDSTIAEIWLPTEACLQFERTFGLRYDEASELYLVSESQHNALLALNPNITITVAPYTQAADSSKHVDITLPYAAFDQTAKPPYQGIKAASRYFPLRRATNETEYTLGRTFLQEAYLTVDWERSNFSVAQTRWVPNAQKSIVSIAPSKSSTSSMSTVGGGGRMSSLGVGAIAGIAIAAVVIIFFSTLITVLYLRKKRRTDAQHVSDDIKPKTFDTTTSRDEEDSVVPTVFPKAELDASEPKRYEAGGDDYYKPGTSHSSQAGLVHESDSKEREVYEMPGDMPSMQEADGRQMSEKEAIRLREERINGTDISPITPADSDRSPSSTLNSGTVHSTRSNGLPGRTLITPGEILELNTAGENRTMLVSPLDGTNGANTMMFSTLTGMTPLSPVAGGTGSSTDESRQRFSYENP